MVDLRAVCVFCGSSTPPDMVTTGLLKQDHRKLLPRAKSSEEALGWLASAEPGYVEKWITAEER